MEVLSQLLNKAVRSGNVKYHPLCSKVGSTHLSFADDLTIFSEATKSSLHGIRDIISNFQDMSGLKVGDNKSELFCCSVNDDNQQVLADLLRLKRGRLPVQYLGVPLILGKLKDSDCNPLINKITSNIRSWTSRLLSFAG